MIYQYNSHADTVMFDNITPSEYEWNNVRPLDVATGDLDGDQMDEIVTAFRFGDANYGTVMLLYMDVISETTETDPTLRTLRVGNIISKEIEISNLDYHAGLKRLDQGRRPGRRRLRRSRPGFQRTVCRV